MSTRAGAQQAVQAVQAVEDTAFSFVCVGVSGGPFETDCSSYLMKLADKKWSEGTTLLEAGSWLGALKNILCEPNHAFFDAEFPEATTEAKVELINSWVDQAIISHGHLDHIFGLVLASAVQRVQKPVYGLQDTLETITEAFNGRLWPRLASFNAKDPFAFYHLRPYVY
ncbi:3',5'-cyclic-nucleotide phosphodiesterase [Malassezia psittaci]|uniref:3',5'-cyclic-nucleotide phosphodiesterase n=1 Tax=Malassezia psittaci TaxID=1821823 RepID=A0AAF0FAM3_9BASI|nr:3',5'-cyclic-nucleotide phosphodiesterase [Malassezia psittaci]